MKKLLFILLVFLSACNTTKKEDKTAAAIKAVIIKNAMGADIKYKPLSTDTVATLYAGTELKYLLKQRFDTDTLPMDTVIKYFDEELEIAKADNNTTKYAGLSYSKNRVIALASKKPTDVDCFVLKHHYTINNPLLNNTLVDITNYYFFNSNDSIIGSVDENDFKDMKRDHIHYETEPYEYALFTFSY